MACVTASRILLAAAAAEMKAKDYVTIDSTLRTNMKEVMAAAMR